MNKIETEIRHSSEEVTSSRPIYDSKIIDGVLKVCRLMRDDQGRIHRDLVSFDEVKQEYVDGSDRVNLYH